MSAACVEVHQREQLCDPLGAPAGLDARQTSVEVEDLARRQEGIEIRVLRQEPDLIAELGLGDVAPQDRSGPEVGRISPIRIFSVVVLPAPFGPTKPKISPSERAEAHVEEHPPFDACRIPRENP